MKLTKAQIEAIKAHTPAERIMEAPGLSWGELAEIKAECERIARRAGLLREAHENGIC